MNDDVADPKDSAMSTERIPTNELVGALRYKKERKLGEGTFGVVYLCYDKLLSRYVAIKKVRAGNSRDGVSVPAIREIKLLQEIHHANIINLFDVYASTSNVHLVLEYAVTDLEHMINDRQLLFSASMIKTMLFMMLNALKKLHECWTLHRDLKPGNVLLGPQGELKLADFGLATIHGGNVDAGDKRNMTNNVVTRWYRAPELLFGSCMYSEGIDMWSMGCIFAEIILRRPYLDGESDLDQLGKIFGARGVPNEDEVWDGCENLDGFVQFKSAGKRASGDWELFGDCIGRNGVDLFGKMMKLDPNARISAKDALQHEYFSEAQNGILDAIELLQCVRKGNCIPKSVPECVWSAHGIVPQQSTGDAHPAVAPTPAHRSSNTNSSSAITTQLSSLRKRKLEFS